VSTVTSSPSAPEIASCTVIDFHVPPMSYSFPSDRRITVEPNAATAAPCTSDCVISVRLEHGELGVVGVVRALVAEIPADLEDLLDPADDQALQVKLKRDPQASGRSPNRAQPAGGVRPGKATGYGSMPDSISRARFSIRTRNCSGTLSSVTSEGYR
jgi:hypothetical protein